MGDGGLPECDEQLVASGDYDEDDYEELDGGNHLLGFMFGNVDDSGDLDADYLDEDAKEHLFALADKLGPSLADIDLIKSSSAHIDPSEPDYDEKAEDAVDYEDIDEEYDGPEIEATTEEDHLLPRKEYFSTALHSSFENKASVFDDENYDEEEASKDIDVGDTVMHSCPSEQLELTLLKVTSPDDNTPSAVYPNAEDVDLDSEGLQEEAIFEQEQIGSHSGTSLPVLCIEDGNVILRFSEIFGVHEPTRKSRKDHHRRTMNKELPRTLNAADIIEDDEEIFLRSAVQDFSNAKQIWATQADIGGHLEQAISDVTLQRKDSCICAKPMKDDVTVDMLAPQRSPVYNFYPLDQEDWEKEVIWGNSPAQSCGYSESCELSEQNEEVCAEDEAGDFHAKISNADTVDMAVASVVEPFDSSEDLATRKKQSRLEHPHENHTIYSTESNDVNGSSGVSKGDVLQRFSKLSLLNKDFLEGSWLDNIIWDSIDDAPKPKLILDLQDDQMLFEILEEEKAEQLRVLAGAMIMTQPSKPSMEENHDHHSLGMASSGRFNISNDKYYSNRKTSQQAKSHAKKRAYLGIKVMHSIPALKLQTMKPRLSKKEIANFHRSKTLWYPRENEIAAKVKGPACSHGPMKVILLSLGGKGVKLNVNAEETLLSMISRASKKLDFRPSEKVKVFHSGRELEDEKSLAMQNVQPNSVLHLVRTKILPWPRAQKLPGENKPLRPPGAFKRKSELSVKDGHVFLMEYCEERPLLLGNVGMGARLCTYYQKNALADQTALSLRNGNNGLGTVLTLDPADKSPFLGDIGPGCSQSCLETNMYRAPIFPHKVSSTDYLLVRSAKGVLSLRRIDKLYVVGQQEPHMEVPSPGTKNVQTYIVNRMLVFVYREFLAREKPGFLPQIRADELASQFPNLTDAIIRKRLKHCADIKKGSHGQLLWVRRRDFRIPSEEELRRLLTPESVCCYESMQAGLYRLKHLGIQRLTHPVGLSSAMNQLPDEAIALAAGSHIERELQITSWNLTSNFVACTNQDRENIERLEITGVGDPSGRGLGFSYVRVTPKAPLTSSVVKKKATVAKGTTVTGTDADLRRLSMDAAREVLLKFNVPEEQIEKLTRWHRIAMVRKLSSEQAASGVKVDATALSKFARGQRMSFMQLQQQTREKCQEIWDRQVQNLSAADGDENDSDSEENSDLDSFAGDLENLLDAEEFEEEDAGNVDLKSDKADGVRGLKMRRCPSQAQNEEEIEDDEAEAAVLIRMLEEDETDAKKKQQLTGTEGQRSQLENENIDPDKKAKVEKLFAEGSASTKALSKKGKMAADDIPVVLVKKKGTIAKDGVKVFKEKKHGDKPVRESFVCGACGQLGHMRTNKNCPKYGEDLETSELEVVSGKSNIGDVASQHQLRTPSSKKIPKILAKASDAEVPENAEKAKVIPVKFKCGPPDKPQERNLSETLISDKQIADTSMESKSTGKINKIIISNKTKLEDGHHEIQKPSVVIRPPADIEKEQPRKKVIIKQPKVLGNAEKQKQVDFGIDQEFRKTKKITELSSNFEKGKKEENQWFTEKTIQINPTYDKKGKGTKNSKEKMAEERSRKLLEEERMHEEHQRLFEARLYEEAKRKELEKAKKKKKKKKPDFKDEYLLELRPYRNNRRIPERDRAVKRRSMVDTSEYAPTTKRRRGGEVELSNILERIVDLLRDNRDVSFLFLKPVTKKEAPDYLDIIECPMDLATIREKVRNMEYKCREEFRHDVWQITYNAHKYNDGRHPNIPPLADQLLEICDYHLAQNDSLLSDAEAGIEYQDS